jgi:hypothetical protein
MRETTLDIKRFKRELKGCVNGSKIPPESSRRFGASAMLMFDPNIWS